MADSYTHTGTDVFQYVTRQFGDEAGIQITADDILRWINIAQLDIAQENEFTRTTAVRPLEKDVAEYTSPESILNIQSIYFDGKPLQYKSFREFQESVQKSDTANATGSPAVWSDWGNSITVWPTPDVDGELKVFYLAMPDSINNIGDALSVPDRLYSILLRFVMAHAYQLDEQYDAANMQESAAMGSLQRRIDDPDLSALEEYPSMTILSEFDL